MHYYALSMLYLWYNKSVDYVLKSLFWIVLKHLNFALRFLCNKCYYALNNSKTFAEINLSLKRIDYSGIVLKFLVEYLDYKKNFIFTG